MNNQGLTNKKRIYYRFICFIIQNLSNNDLKSFVC